MKITLSELKQIIREEVKRARRVLKENLEIRDDALIKFAESAYAGYKTLSEDQLKALSEPLKESILQKKSDILSAFKNMLKTEYASDNMLRVLPADQAKKRSFRDILHLDEKIKSLSISNGFMLTPLPNNKFQQEYAVMKFKSNFVYTLENEEEQKKRVQDKTEMPNVYRLDFIIAFAVLGPFHAEKLAAGKKMRRELMLQIHVVNEADNKKIDVLPNGQNFVELGNW